MQRSAPAISVPRDGSSLEALSARFDAQWGEMARFLLDRKLRAEIYHGESGDLSPVQVHALQEMRGEVSMGELAERLGLAESSVTRLVDRLEELGLAERRPGVRGEDRRRVLASLTRSGRARVERAERARSEFMREILSTLEEREQRTLVRLFDKVVKVLEEREAEAVAKEKGGRA